MSENAKVLLWAVLIYLSAMPTVSFAAYCEVGEPDSYKAPYDLEECPPDIQSWMDRLNGCQDIKAKKSQGSTNFDVLDDMYIDLECEFIACDYVHIKQKYHGNGVLTNIIEGYKTLVFGPNTALVCGE